MDIDKFITKYCFLCIRLRFFLYGEIKLFFICKYKVYDDVKVMKLDSNMTERNHFAHETIFAITKCYTKQITKQARTINELYS